MRLKYYLRGLGIGIIITTLILLIVYNIRGTKISDDEIINRATELGMVMSEENKSNQESGKLSDISDTGTTEIENATSDNEISTDADTTDADTSDSITEITPTEEDPVEETTDKITTGEITSGEETTDNATDIDKSNDASSDSKTTENDMVETEDFQEEYAEFVVKPGQVSMTVAKNLMAAGIIDDADAFNTYIQDTDYDNCIRVGTYSIKKGSDYDTIINTITKKQ